MSEQVYPNYSVLMAIYRQDRTDWLQESLLSMINQTIKPIEIVIVEDGPLTCYLNEFLDAFVQSHPELKRVKLMENSGLGVALAEGIKHCSSELVARMDADDISLPHRCEKQLQAFMADSNLSICGSHIDEFNEDPSIIISSREVPTDHQSIVKFSKRRNPFNHPTVMYKKSAVIESGNYSDLRRNQDYELFLRMLSKGYQSKNLDESLLLFRANQDNLQRRKSWSKTKSHVALEYRFFIKRYIGFTDFIFVSFMHILVSLLPVKLFKQFSTRILRRKRGSQ